MSALIRVACDDLEACQKDPRYQINMIVWHTPAEEKCLVCLAGAVMARTYKMPWNRFVDPGYLKEPEKFQALDYVRRGLFRLAVPHLGIEPDPSQSGVLRKLVRPYRPIFTILAPFWSASGPALVNWRPLDYEFT